MNIIVIDQVGTGAKEGPGSPAYFSRFAIAHLRACGHSVEIISRFEPQRCSEADLVWCEWTNETAFEAAASGLCRRLVLRMRGYDVFFPLHELQWKNVSLLVYESPLLREHAVERFPVIATCVPAAVLASGIDVGAFHVNRERTNVVAMLARADYRKGHQLAIELAHRRPDLRIHTTLACAATNPRLGRFLSVARPSNFYVHEEVPDVAEFLHTIKASYVLSTSLWEDLGYSIAEGMAAGCMPLVYAFPNAEKLWPRECLWRTLDDLDSVLKRAHEPEKQRAFVEQNYDERKQSRVFADIITALPAREVSYANYLNGMAARVVQNVRAGTPQDNLLTTFRELTADEHGARRIRSDLATLQAGAHFALDNVKTAEVWALRALQYRPRGDAFRLLAEAAWAAGAYQIAREWCALDPSSGDRLRDMQKAERRVLPERYSRPVHRHALLVQTAPRARETLSRLLDTIDRDGGWNGPKVVAVDGRSNVPTAWRGSCVHASPNTSCVGQVKTLLTGLRAVLAQDWDVITILEDDAVLTKNALNYIRIVAGGTTTSWYTPLQCPYEDAKQAFFSVRRMDGFSRFVAVTLPRKAALELADGLSAWPDAHGGDMVLSRRLPQEEYALHFPAIVDHDGVSLVGNTEERGAPTFLGEDFDALDLLG